MQAQVPFGPLLAAEPLAQLLPAGIHQRRVERRGRQHAAEEAAVRFVLGGQRADEAEQARRLRVAVAGRQCRLGRVPLAEIGLEQAPQEVFLGGEVVGDAAAGDAAFLDELVESERAGAVALDDLAGGGEDLVAGKRADGPCS